MFRVKGTAESRGVLWATIGLLVFLMAATGVTVWLVLEINKEQKAIDEIVAGGFADDIERLGTLPGEVRWQFRFTIIVLIVLVVAAVVLGFIVRAYLKSQTALREIKVQAWHILASTDQGVMTTDCERQITSVNPQALILLDVDLTCVGGPLENLCDEGPALDEVSRQVLESGEPRRDRRFTATSNGHPAQLRAECHVLRDTDHQVLGTVWHIRDVTKELLIEERMRRMERFMGLGTLSAGLHHEIKNPLSALSLHVQLLEERLEGTADDEVAENLGVIKTEVTRILRVLENFRDYASLDQLNAVETDIAELVKRTVDLMRPKAEQQNVRIELGLPSGGDSRTIADSARLEQVLLNLVLNSLAEMPSGGKLGLSVTCEDGMICITVSDTGRGIPANIKSQVFDPYFTTKSDGSGMGLAVCDKIIRQHGGQIDMETGRTGTVFRLSLPVDES